MWNGKDVSVVLMTYAERDSIRAVVDGFLATGYVDEVVVVDNNAEPGTREAVAGTPARVVAEPRQGYGHATRRGLQEARGELVVIAEPDGTFLPDDITKLLVYSGECDVVLGTRTTRELIWADANMDWFLRWGNWAVAKLIEVLFNTVHLSDVGCTYRRPAAAGRPAGRGRDAGRREPRRRRDHAAGADVRRAGRRGPAQLPAACRHVLGHRPPARRDRRRPADDRPDPPLPPPHPARHDPAGGLRPRRMSSHFDTIAGEYDAALPPHVVEHYLRKRTAYVVAHCPPGRGLDVGCGTGVLAARLARAGWTMTGADPSGGMLDVLRARSPEVTAVQASGTALPFPDDAFDVVLSVATLHHIADADDVRRTLAEMVRVVRPGGRVLVWDHNPRNPYWGPLMRRVPQDTGEERLIGEAEVLEGLRGAGAAVVSSRQLGLVPDFVPPRALGAAAAVERAVERTPLIRRLGAHNVVLAAKPG